MKFLKLGDLIVCLSHISCILKASFVPSFHRRASLPASLLYGVCRTVYPSRLNIEAISSSNLCGVNSRNSSKLGKIVLVRRTNSLLRSSLAEVITLRCCSSLPPLSSIISPRKLLFICASLTTALRNTAENTMRATFPAFTNLCNITVENSDSKKSCKNENRCGNACPCDKH